MIGVGCCLWHTTRLTKRPRWWYNKIDPSYGLSLSGKNALWPISHFPPDQRRHMELLDPNVPPMKTSKSPCISLNEEIYPKICQSFWIPKSALWWYNSNVEKVWLAFVLNYALVTYLVQSRACLYIDHPIKYRKLWHTYLMFGTCPRYFIHLIRQEPEYNNVRIYFVPPLCLI